MQHERRPDGRQTAAAESSAGGPNAAHEAGIHLPAPTICPFVCAAGIGLLGFGILTTLVFSALGVLLIAWSLGGWIREMLHE
jgi:hypothetical protein